MKNYLVLHKLNGSNITRWDFAENLATAVKFAHTLADNCYQSGKHLIIIKEEFSNEILGDYTLEFTL